MLAYILQQHKFISDEQSHYPLICDTRWINMKKATTWFDKHQLYVITHFEEKNPAFMPDK